MHDRADHRDGGRGAAGGGGVHHSGGECGDRATPVGAETLLQDGQGGVTGQSVPPLARLGTDMVRSWIEARADTDTVEALAARIPGMRGVFAGRLRNARQVEALTINLVSVNRRYKVHAGIRVTDV